MPHSVSETQETPYSWFRMLVGMVICSIGGVGMWSVVVALPAVQAEFGSARSGASLPYTLVMLGIAAGGVLMGRMADKKGIVPPMLFGAVSLCAGYVLSGFATSLWQFAVLHGVLIGALGSSVTFGAGSRWRYVRRGIISPGRSGRVWCSMALTRWGGGQRISGSGFSALSRLFRWRCFSGGGRLL